MPVVREVQHRVAVFGDAADELWVPQVPDVDLWAGEVGNRGGPNAEVSQYCRMQQPFKKGFFWDKYLATLTD